MKLESILLYMTCVVVVFGCAGAGPGSESLDQEAFGQNTLRFASSLTKYEVDNLQKLKNGADKEAFLDLALMMGGLVRTAEDAAPIKDRYNAFIESMKKPVRNESDPKKKGQLLFKAFHTDLLGFNEENPKKTKYERDQTTVDGILRTGEYNCLSSSILFALIAREFNFKVEGARVPSHVFLELKHPNASKAFEVETTSWLGFDLKHNKAFFDEQAGEWARLRGLTPTTYKQYKNREKVSLKTLILSMHNVQHTYEGQMDKINRIRLMEIVGFLSEKRNHQKARLGTWANLMGELVNDARYEDVLRIEENIEDELLRVAKKVAGDEELEIMAIAVLDMGAVAKSRLGRHKQAMAGQLRIDELFGIKTLRQNRVYIFQKAAVPAFEGRNWKEAIEICTACQKGMSEKSKNACLDNLQIAYLNWSSVLAASGDKAKAKSLLKKCIAYHDSFQQCKERLAALEQ